MRTISQTQFRSRVLGPVGLYVTMKERYKKYGNAVEKVLFRTLHTFVVDNVEDRNRLVSMLRKANLYSKFHVIFQTFRGRYQPTPLADPSLILVSDTIHVKEDIIFNVLVDQARIDEIIVVEDESDSDSKTVRNGDRMSFPPGIHSAVAVDGRTILYRNGNKSSEVNRFPYRQLLAEDTQEVIQNLSQQMQVLRQEIHETENELGGLRLEEKKLNDNRKQIESQVSLTERRGRESGRGGGGGGERNVKI
jgi:chromosome segregation ATPase